MGLGLSTDNFAQTDSSWLGTFYPGIFPSRPGPSAAEVKEGEAGKASNFDRRVWLPRRGQDEKHIGIRGREGDNILTYSETLQRGCV